MVKKIMFLAMAAFTAASYADIVLDLHVVLTQDGSVKEINKQVIVEENNTVELHRCEGGQLLGCVTNVTESGAVLDLQVNECDGKSCSLISNQPLHLIWNEKRTIDIAHEDASLTIEVTAQQVPIQ